MWWNEDTISVGASGTIIGMYGVMLALIYEQYYRPKISAKIVISLTIFLIYNFIALMIGAADNAAIVGGLITGFISGILILPWMKPESQNAES
jgi:membrane associated rhomboid family serine protease